MTSKLITPDWPAPANIRGGTTTRLAGASVLPNGLRFLHQVHKANVVTADQAGRSADPLEADAVCGHEDGDTCAVRTADCLPVLLCSITGDRIAAAHAGWRGLAAGVLENTVAAMKCPPGELLAWFGPAISQANFEVGAEVREVFVAHDRAAASCFDENDRGRWQADLYELARQRLQQCGVEAIYGGGWCTFADAERFYSYRRDQTQSRLISFIELTSSASSLQQALK